MRLVYKRRRKKSNRSFPAADFCNWNRFLYITDQPHLSFIAMNAINRIMRFTGALVVAIIGFVQCAAPGGRTENSPRLVLMGLSAHPDDEDAATLAYYARLKGVKTYSVFFTRGEGGQNEIGSELYEDLGALRTKETLASAELSGSEVYFLGFPDFGF